MLTVKSVKNVYNLLVKPITAFKNSRKWCERQAAWWSARKTASRRGDFYFRQPLSVVNLTQFFHEFSNTLSPLNNKAGKSRINAYHISSCKFLDGFNRLLPKKIALWAKTSASDNLLSLSVSASSSNSLASCRACWGFLGLLYFSNSSSLAIPSPSRSISFSNSFRRSSINFSSSVAHCLSTSPGGGAANSFFERTPSLFLSEKRFVPHRSTG